MEDTSSVGEKKSSIEHTEHYLAAENVGSTNGKQENLTNDDKEPEQPHEGTGEGTRLTHLRKALHKTVRRSLSTIRQRDLNSNFRPLHLHNPEILKNIRKKLLKQLDTNISDEISKMFDEESIVPLMNGIDELEKQEADGNKEWRPSGKPKVDVRPYLHPVRVKYRDQLAGILKELESRNRMLQDIVRVRQAKLHTTRNHLSETCAVWSKAENVIPPESLDAMRNFVSTNS